MKKWTYTISLIALGIVVFNNVVQTAEILESNQNLLIGLMLSLIGTLVYGLVNIKN